MERQCNAVGRRISVKDAFWIPDVCCCLKTVLSSPSSMQGKAVCSFPSQNSPTQGVVMSMQCLVSGMSVRGASRKRGLLGWL